MKQIDKTVIKETKYIAFWVLIFSALLQAVFLVLQKWDYTVLLGNLLGGGATVLNFFLMGLSVQNALEKDEKEARQTIQSSRSLRMLFLFVVAVIGISVPCFHYIATLIPYLFPRVAIALRPAFDKKMNGEEGDHASK